MRKKRNRSPQDLEKGRQDEDSQLRLDLGRLLLMVSDWLTDDFIQGRLEVEFPMSSSTGVANDSYTKPIILYT